MDTMDRVTPYGFMAEGFQRCLTYEHPSAWSDAATYDAWLASELARLTEDAWPEWAGAMGWVGTARAHAVELTLADLALMDVLCHAHYDAPSRHRREKHNWWFEQEDSLFGNFAKRHATGFHDSGIDARQFEDAFIAGGDKVLSTRTSWWLKWRLQRPRPNQMAYVLQRPAPRLQLASSAWSPSAISGHAFQGLMGCVEIHRTHGPGAARPLLTPEGLRELAFLATDIGDRRVFGGVHYPSDNAMSWRVALSFLDRIGDKASAKFASDAILGSVVYAAMKSSPPHARCLALVEELLT